MAMIEITDLKKSYKGGFEALKGVNLDIEEGEILALLGPNGAGKTTLISSICGIVEPTSGTVRVGGYDIADDFRAARRMIGLVPQELTLEPFAPVLDTVRYSRGLFGESRDDDYVQELLTRLSLWDKHKNRVRELSGGMKRRVLIAKALSHRPRVLFLDEPTAGVDVELRKDMWDLVEELRRDGVTIILTTHYIEEAEAIADRIGVINSGQLLLVEEKTKLIQQMGQKTLTVELSDAVTKIPDVLAKYDLKLERDGLDLVYNYDTRSDRTGITALLNDLQHAGLRMIDIRTAQSSLEDIFVSLVQEGAA